MSNKYDVNNYEEPVFGDLESFLGIPKAWKKYETMKTDIKEEENNYVLNIDIPGAKKEDINVKLNDGYLEVSYSVNEHSDEQKHGKFIRKERYYGSMSRSFYVGENVEEKDVNASYENGVLTIVLPKEVEEKKQPSRIEIK